MVNYEKSAFLKEPKKSRAVWFGFWLFQKQKLFESQTKHPLRRAAVLNFEIWFLGPIFLLQVLLVSCLLLKLVEPPLELVSPA
jgi:hypothetical protein